MDETDIINIDETDVLINLAHKRLRNVVFRCTDGVNLYYCGEGLYASSIDCGGEQAFVLVRAESPSQAADKIRKMVSIECEENDKGFGGRRMNVLSLFDGISCGRLALHRAGIPIGKYYASEMDKHAVKVTMANFPDTIQLGDVRKIDFKQFTGKIDLLIGGSPCQDLSLSGKRAGLQGERSGLFYKFVEALNTIKPRYFLLENNVGMPMDAYEEISRLMGCYPVEINSALVSAQSRRRYYWTNIRLRKARLFGLPHSDIPQPEDKGIILQDILENGTAFRTKSVGLCAVDCKVAKTWNMLDRWTKHQESPAKAVLSDDATDSNGRTAEGYRVYHVRNGYADLWDDSSPQNVSRFGETVNIGYIGTGHRQGYSIYSEKSKSATLMASGEASAHADKVSTR